MEEIKKIDEIKKKEPKKEEFKSAVDMLLDQNDDDDIILFNESGDKMQFEQIAVVPIDETIYAILKPTEEMEGVKDDEAIVFKIVETDDDEWLEIEENDEKIDKVFEIYYKMLKDEGIE